MVPAPRSRRGALAADETPWPGGERPRRGHAIIGSAANGAPRARRCAPEREGGAGQRGADPDAPGGDARGACRECRQAERRERSAPQRRSEQLSRSTHPPTSHQARPPPPPPPPPLRTNRTRRVPHPVLIGHAASAPRHVRPLDRAAPRRARQGADLRARSGDAARLARAAAQGRGAVRDRAGAPDLGAGGGGEGGCAQAVGLAAARDAQPQRAPTAEQRGGRACHEPGARRRGHAPHQPRAPRHAPKREPRGAAREPGPERGARHEQRRRQLGHVAAQRAPHRARWCTTPSRAPTRSSATGRRARASTQFPPCFRRSAAARGAPQSRRTGAPRRARRSASAAFPRRTGPRPSRTTTRRHVPAAPRGRARPCLPPSRTDWTRLVPPPVLTGHVSSLLPD